MNRIEVDGRDVVGIRAENPGPLSLSGTNSWIVGRDPAWMIDPGPALPAHVDALAAELDARGGVGGIVLTHDHIDHCEALPDLRARLGPVTVAAARGAVDVTLAGGARIGPFEALATPGHAPDHVVLISGDVAFTGDAVLGEGSVFIAPDPGALRGYLDALTRLGRRNLAVICPGHGPLVTDPARKLDEYVAHRIARENALLDTLAGGARTAAQLLDAVWADVPEILRPAAAVTLAAHLDKLDDEGRLPPGVERPAF